MRVTASIGERGHGFGFFERAEVLPLEVLDERDLDNLGVVNLADNDGQIAQAEAVLSRVALMDQADQKVAALPHGDQRKLEVALLIALDPDVLMFDEPTAGMSVDDVPVILDLITGLKADPAKTILLVEHKMDVIRSLADRIIVLHNGRLVADGEPAAVIASPIVQQAYLGTEPAEAAHG